MKVDVKHVKVREWPRSQSPLARANATSTATAHNNKRNFQIPTLLTSTSRAKPRPSQQPRSPTIMSRLQKLLDEQAGEGAAGPYPPPTMKKAQPDDTDYGQNGGYALDQSSHPKAQIWCVYSETRPVGASPFADPPPFPFQDHEATRVQHRSPTRGPLHGAEGKEVSMGPSQVRSAPPGRQGEKCEMDVSHVDPQQPVTVPATAAPGVTRLAGAGEGGAGGAESEDGSDGERGGGSQGRR